MRNIKFHKRILSLILSFAITFPLTLAVYADTSGDAVTNNLLGLNNGLGITYEQLESFYFFRYKNDEDKLAGKSNVELKRLKGSGFLGLGSKVRMDDAEWSAYLKKNHIPEKMVQYCEGREIECYYDPFEAISYYYELDNSVKTFFDGHIQDLVDKGYVYYRLAEYTSFSYAPFLVTNYWIDKKGGDGTVSTGDFSLSYVISGNKITFTVLDDVSFYCKGDGLLGDRDGFDVNYKKGHTFTYPYMYVDWDETSSESQETQDEILDDGSKTYDTTVTVTDNDGRISKMDEELHPDGVVNDGTNNTSEYVTIEEHKLKMELENSPLGQANIDPLEVASNYAWYDGDINATENSGIRALRSTTSSFYSLITTICIIGLITTYAYQGMRLALMGYKVKNDVMATLLYKSLLGTVIFGFGALWGLFANVIIEIASL